MKLDLLLAGESARDCVSIARLVEDCGFDGLGITDTGRSALMGCAAASVSSTLHISSAVAVAFPLSPMTMAQMAWELTELTGGRFRLGLGAQVEAHIVRRFSAAYAPPGPRLREYVRALRAIFAAFNGDRLNFEGDFYSFSLLPEEWSPGPIAQGVPPIDIAAVNPWMLRMAGEFADGVHVHPLNTRNYLDRVVKPNLATGANRAGRAVGDIHLTIPFFGVGGDTEAEREPARQLARQRIAFYGTTPNYEFIFADMGYPDTTRELQRYYRAHDVENMIQVISDEILDQLIVSGPWDGLAQTLVDRFGDDADRVVLYTAGLNLAHDRSMLERWGHVGRELNSLSSKTA